MVERILVDSDIVLDLLAKRQPFYRFAARVFTLADRRRVTLTTTPLVFANVFYILRKLVGIEEAQSLLRKLRLILGLVAIDEKIVDLALNSSFSDFEDGIQYFAAREHGLGTLLTRNTRDYAKKGVLVLSPEEFLKSSPLSGEVHQ